MFCPVCKKQLSRMPHYRKCRPKNQSKEDFLFDILNVNHKKLCENNGKLLKNLYIQKDYSILDIIEYLNNDISSKQIYFLLEKFNISKKGVKGSANSKRTREKYKKTCTEKYGTENSLSKGTMPYEKKNKTVKEKYGVDNVFQLEEVKNKLNETMLETYGSLRICNPEKQKETLKNRPIEKKIEHYTNLSIVKKKQWENYTDEQKYDRISKLFKNNQLSGIHKINKLETKISNALVEIGVSFYFSHYVKRRQFDFKIGENILIEVQGDYWHANPKFYKEDDIINYPRGKFKAKDIWDKDEEKKKIAEKYGYDVFYIWEDEVKYMNEREIATLIKDKIESKLHHLRSN
jgi:hypothetical protein